MKIVFRVDASTRIGSGHVMRCVTLAHQLKQVGAEITFLSKELYGNMIGFVEYQGFKVIGLSSEEEFDWMRDSDETIATIQGINPDLLIVDSYHFDVKWEDRVKLYVRKLMVIDDLANRGHNCDMLLDQNYYHDCSSRYHGLVPKSCNLLLGPSYVLLREEFIECVGRMREREGPISNILVFFGGSDPTNETSKVLRALSVYRDISQLKVNVIVGSSNPHIQEVEKLCRLHPTFNMYEQVTTISTFMNEADLAIGAGGTSTWERCFMGLPSLVIVIADNQRELTEAVCTTQAIINLGSADEVTEYEIVKAFTSLREKPEIVRSMGKAASKLVNSELVKSYPVRKEILEVLQS